MRTMMKFSVPVQAGNDVMRSGRLGEVMGRLMDQVKPEACYFTSDDTGQRGGYIVFDLEDPSAIPVIAEPLFQELQASLRFMPVMDMDDLQRAMTRLQP